MVNEKSLRSEEGHVQITIRIEYMHVYPFESQSFSQYQEQGKYIVRNSMFQN